MLRAPLHGGEGDLQIPCLDCAECCRPKAAAGTNDLQKLNERRLTTQPSSLAAWLPSSAHLWPVKECVQKPPSTSQTRTVRSAEAVASRPPDASTAMSATGALCPLKLRSACPFSSDQQRSWRLRDAVKSCRALGLRARAVSGSESCRQAGRGGWRQAAAAGFSRACAGDGPVAAHRLFITSCTALTGRHPPQAPQSGAACMVGCRDAPRAASAARHRSMDPLAWPHQRKRTPAAAHRAKVAQGRLYKRPLVSGALCMSAWALSWSDLTGQACRLAGPRQWATPQLAAAPCGRWQRGSVAGWVRVLGEDRMQYDDLGRCRKGRCVPWQRLNRVALVGACGALGGSACDDHDPQKSVGHNKADTWL